MEEVLAALAAADANGGGTVFVPGGTYRLNGTLTVPTGVELRGIDPRVRALVMSGYYDLATPYFATDYTVDHMQLEPELRDNIRVAYFEAGHMMYIHEPLLPQWKETLDAFIDRTSGGN